MAKTNDKLHQIFSEITKDLKEVFGDTLISIILYGSGAGGDYIHGKSDLNFLTVISDDGLNKLYNAVDTVKRWRKRNVAVPLFMTKDEILSSLDAYPVEFLNIKSNYLMVFGKDILKDLHLDRQLLRLQCERELKAKIIHLRTGFLDSGGRAKSIRELIRISLTAFISIFKVLIYLKGVNIPHTRREIIKCVALEFSINPDVFLICADIKEGVDKISDSEIFTVFSRYLAEVKKLSQIVDCMDE